jgi:hypothetical protein
MCSKCDVLDKRIEHYLRLSQGTTDALTVERIAAMVAGYRAEKIDLHPENKT